ncbi:MULTISPECIES: hypothetical protein [Paenibacillus]|uniref:hypothetical protein n=1 Tax=Paenibacillus TaxID=44249 RepID=UPI00096D6E9C|nr:hypothetical protein [Paenibacillus odorifer]OMD08501.1 hypothetical protein BJP50_07910 [Paenibacillus odorifer]
MKKNQLKWFKYTLLSIFIIFLIYTYVGNIGVVREYIKQDVENGTIGEFIKNSELEQSFYTDQSNLSGISVRLATYMRTNKGSLLIGIREMGSDKNIYENKIQVDSVRDNEMFDFRFPPIKFSKGKIYSIYIKSIDTEPGESITVYKSNEESYENGKLYINGNEQKGDLVFRAYYNRTIFDYLKNKLGG